MLSKDEMHKIAKMYEQKFIVMDAHTSESSIYELTVRQLPDDRIQLKYWGDSYDDIQLINNHEVTVNYKDYNSFDDVIEYMSFMRWDLKEMILSEGLCWPFDIGTKLLV